MKTMKFKKIQEELKKLEAGEAIELSLNGLNSKNLKGFGFNFVNDYIEDEIEVCGYYMHEELYMKNGNYYISSYGGSGSAYLRKISKEEYHDKLKYIFYVKAGLRGVDYYDYYEYRHYVERMRKKKIQLEERRVGYPYFYSKHAA